MSSLNSVGASQHGADRLRLRLSVPRMQSVGMTRRLTDYALGLIAWLVGSFHDEWTYWRRRWNCRGERHLPVCMTDVHVCGRCGTWGIKTPCPVCGVGFAN